MNEVPMEVPVREDGDETLPDFCRKRTLILGCGNVLFGDDGFGSELVEYLEQHIEIPSDVCVLDTGTGVRSLLFTLCLSPVRPERLLVVDAVDMGRVPGELFEINPAEIPFVKLEGFSLHQVPTTNMLCELAEGCGVEVRVLACQTGPLPNEVSPGLSDAVRRSVPPAAELIASRYF